MKMKIKIKEFLPLLLILLPFNMKYLYPKKSFKFKEHQTLKKDIKAPFSYPVYKTEKEIKEEIKKLKNNLPLILSFSEKPVKKAKRVLKGIKEGKLQILSLSKETKTLLLSKKRDTLLNTIEKTTEEIFSHGYFLLKDEYPLHRRVLIERKRDTLQREIKNVFGPSDIDSILKEKEKIYFPRSSKLRRAYTEVTLSIIAPNLFLNKKKTAELIKNLDISRIKYIVYKDEVIGKKGDRINAKMFEKLKTLNELRFSRRFWIIILEENILVLAILLFFFISLKTVFLQRDKKIVLISLVSSIFLFLSILLGRINMYFTLFLSIGLILSMFYGAEIAIVSGLFLAIIFVLFFETSFSYYLFLLGLLIPGAFFSERIETRFEFYKPLMYGTLSGFFVYLFLNPGLCVPFKKLGIVFLFISGGSILSVVLAYFLMPFFERVGEVVSQITLSRLADLNHPLLKEFALRAPGSYNHSLTLARLVEEAAQALGINTRLAVCGAYYHDIGKMVKPEYFIENQYTDNPHENLKPKISTLILQSHAKEGVKIAKKAGLPKAVIKIIEEHHGTTLMEYFYNKALAENKDVSEDEFRYPGPKPSSKESALVMLADGVEAMIRAEGFESSEDLRRKIDAMIEKRIADGQLDNAFLTYRDIKKIKDAFFKTLLGIHHGRVLYGKGKDIFKRKNRDRKKATTHNKKNTTGA